MSYKQEKNFEKFERTSTSSLEQTVPLDTGKVSYVPNPEFEQERQIVKTLSCLLYTSRCV